MTSGLTAEHFANGGRQGDPGLREISPDVSIERVTDAWDGQPPPAFSVRWSGYLVVRRAGSYTFSLTSDDGSTLRIGGALVVDNSGNHPSQTRTGQIALERGPHALVIEYEQMGGGYDFHWLWARDGATPEPVPELALSPYRIGPATVWMIQSLDALFVPALVAFGVLLIWVAFPPRATFPDQRRHRAEA